jgi:hypothetical protein
MTARAVPSLQIRHGNGDEWWVAATWPDGQIEDIASFKSELDANAWIAKDFRVGSSSAAIKPVRRQANGAGTGRHEERLRR